MLDFRLVDHDYHLPILIKVYSDTQPGLFGSQTWDLTVPEMVVGKGFPKWWCNEQMIQNNYKITSQFGETWKFAPMFDTNLLSFQWLPNMWKAFMDFFKLTSPTSPPKRKRIHVIFQNECSPRWWFQTFFCMFTPNIGEDFQPILTVRIFFKWVGSTSPTVSPVFSRWKIWCLPGKPMRISMWSSNRSLGETIFLPEETRGPPFPHQPLPWIKSTLRIARYCPLVI